MLQFLKLGFMRFHLDSVETFTIDTAYRTY